MTPLCFLPTKRGSTTRRARTCVKVPRAPADLYVEIFAEVVELVDHIDGKRWAYRVSTNVTGLIEEGFMSEREAAMNACKCFAAAWIMRMFKLSSRLFYEAAEDQVQARRARQQARAERHRQRSASSKRRPPSGLPTRSTDVDLAGVAPLRS